MNPDDHGLETEAGRTGEPPAGSGRLRLRFPLSIRWRLQAWQGFLLAGILTGFGLTAYQLHRTHQLGQIDEELGRRLAALGVDVRRLPPFAQPGGPPPFEPGREGHPPRRPGLEFRGSRGRFDGPPELREIRLSPATAGLFDEADTNGFYFAVWSRNGPLLKQSTNLPPDRLPPAPAGPGLRAHVRTWGLHREAFQFTEIGECLLVGRRIAADLERWNRFAWLLAAAGFAVLAFGIGGGWLLTTRALRPIDSISATATRIARGNLADRINVAETDSELGRLAGVLNATFARLETAFSQQQQFIADASHELRTPIAVLISEAQTVLARPRTASEYRETVEGCLQTAQQMRRLAQSLLELARYDAGQEVLQLQPCDLAELARRGVDQILPLARERGLTVHLELAPASMVADPDRLAQAITNLLTNAIHHNRDGGEVRVATRNEPDAAVLAVTDTGPGIAPHDLPHVFERFFRADRSRTGASGRTGLGLAISKAIVETHGGTLGVSSQPGTGTTFTLRVPFISPASGPACSLGCPRG